MNSNFTIASQLRLASNFFLRPLSQFPPQHLSNRTLWDFFNESDASSQLLVVSQSFFHKLLDLFFAQSAPFHRHDIGTWPVGSRVVRSWHTDDSGFFDTRVCEEQVFELGRRDL